MLGCLFGRWRAVTAAPAPRRRQQSSSTACSIRRDTRRQASSRCDRHWRTAASGQRHRRSIGTLNGGTIALSIVADEHTRLKGEVMGIRDEPSGPVSYLVGWFDRDYGRSALVARKDVVIDASALPSGITITWAGTTPARVLAVSGDLTLDQRDHHRRPQRRGEHLGQQPQPAVDARARRRRRRVGRGAPVELPAARQPRRGRFRLVARPRRVRRRGVRRHRAHGALRREWQLRAGRRSGRRRRVLGGRRGELQVGLEHRAFQRQRQRASAACSLTEPAYIPTAAASATARRCA